MRDLFYGARVHPVEILNVPDLACTGLLRVKCDDFPVKFSLVQQAQRTEHLHTLMLAELCNLAHAYFHNVQGVIVPIGLCLPIFVGTILPCLRDAAIVEAGIEEVVAQVFLPCLFVFLCILLNGVVFLICGHLHLWSRIPCDFIDGGKLIGVCCVWLQGDVMPGRYQVALAVGEVGTETETIALGLHMIGGGGTTKSTRGDSEQGFRGLCQHILIKLNITLNSMGQFICRKKTSEDLGYGGIGSITLGKLITHARGGDLILIQEQAYVDNYTLMNSQEAHQLKQFLRFKAKENPSGALIQLWSRVGIVVDSDISDLKFLIEVSEQGLKQYEFLSRMLYYKKDTDRVVAWMKNLKPISDHSQQLMAAFCKWSSNKTWKKIFQEASNMQAEDPHSWMTEVVQVALYHTR
jgi:hypothetical protein